MAVNMKVSNAQTEKKVLNLLCRFGDAIDMVIEYGLEIEDFSTTVNRDLFEYILDGYVENNFVPYDDLESFINNSYFEDEDDRNETIAHITKIIKLKVKIAGVINEVNIKMLPKYIDELKSLTTVRRVITGINKVNSVLMEEEAQHSELLEAVNDNLGNIFDRGKGVVRRSMKEAVRDTVEEIVDESEGLTGIKLSINSELDEKSKIMYGYLTYIAGGPGIGKSAVLNNIATNIESSGAKVLYVTQEMNVNDNVKRTISNLQNIKAQRIQNPSLLNVNDWNKLSELVSEDGKFDNMNIHWFSKDNLTTSALKNEIAKYVRLYDIDVVLIDYYQILQIESNFELSDGARIPRVSSDLREMAKSFYLNPGGNSKQVAIIALSQINKDVEYRENKRPTMNDLYFGGAKDARLVLGLFRDEYYNPDNTDKPNIMEIGILKQNNGVFGEWYDSYFETDLQRIRDLTDEERELLPVGGEDDEYEDDEYDDEDYDE